MHWTDVLILLRNLSWYRFRFPMKLKERTQGSKKLWQSAAGVWCIYGSRARDLFGNLWILSTLARFISSLSLCFLFPLFVQCGRGRFTHLRFYNDPFIVPMNDMDDIWNRNDSCSQLIKTFLPRKLSFPQPVPSCGHDCAITLFNDMRQSLALSPITISAEQSRKRGIIYHAGQRESLSLSSLCATALIAYI